MPVCSIILTMHGQTQWNVEGRIQGQIDTPLNENGRQMSLALRNRLADEQITAIYASDLRRAIETAHSCPGRYPARNLQDGRTNDSLMPHFGPDGIR